MRASREDIVITGLSCRFAESPDPSTFWKHILQRHRLFTPLQTTDATMGPPLFDRPYPSVSAQLNDLYACNAADQYFKREISGGENPALYFMLQLVMDALRDSGCSINSLPTDRISLRMGYAPPFNTAIVNWLQHTFILDQTVGIIQKFFPHAQPDHVATIRAQLAASLPKPNVYAFMSAFGSSVAAWSAHLLGFAGPATTIECGAISAHQSFQQAIDDLLMRRSDIVVTGAIQPPITRPVIQGLAGAITFSRGKTLMPFSREADGTLPGEGGAVFILKRLKDALRDNDRIYAIVHSPELVAASLEHHRTIPLAPERMIRAINRSFKRAKVTADDITYFEAYGSGVPQIDQVELNILLETFGERKASHPLVGIGAVKGNFGHTLVASGAASILKATLAIYHRILPPNIEIEKPYPRLSSAKSPLYLLDEARPWMRGKREHVRRAGVSAVDFTGSCGMTILEEYPGGDE
jgi:acyl transferase domain-containing protein